MIPKYNWQWGIYLLAWLSLQGCLGSVQAEKPTLSLPSTETANTPPPSHEPTAEPTVLDAPLLTALLLAEVGYLTENPLTAPVPNIAAALASFQADIGLPESGVLDETTWAQLKNIRLNTGMRHQVDPQHITLIAQPRWMEYMLAALNHAEITAFRQHCDLPATIALFSMQEFEHLTYAFTHDGVCQTTVPDSTITVVEVPPTADSIDTFRVKYPALDKTATAIEQGDKVFAIEKLDCKGDGHQVWLLIYGGLLRSTADTAQAQVEITDRYAMWFDNRQQGINNTTHLCAPRRRFCYTDINFTDWSGQLAAGDKAALTTAHITAAADGIIFAADQAITRECASALPR